MAKFSFYCRARRGHDMHPSAGTGKQENSVSRAPRAAPIATPSPWSIWLRIALRFQSRGVIHVMTAQRAAQKDNDDDHFYD
jgi:hypothetical protein